MEINIGNNNKFKNVMITEEKSSISEQKVKKKSFTEKHPILVSVCISFVVGVILLFSFWGDVIEFLENLF